VGGAGASWARTGLVTIENNKSKDQVNVEDRESALGYKLIFAFGKILSI
jgi:hypothetical protein